MAYEITWERPFGVIERYSGVIAPDEVARAVETITSDAGFDDLRYVIIDLQSATGHSFDLQSRAALEVPYATMIGARYTNPHIHSAFLATDPGIVQLIELKIARGILPQPARIFSNELQAREWLGQISGLYRRPPLS